MKHLDNYLQNPFYFQKDGRRKSLQLQPELQSVPWIFVPQNNSWALMSNINFVISRLWGLCSKKLLGFFLDILKFVFTFQMLLSETSPGRQNSKSSWCLLGSRGRFSQQRKFSKWEFTQFPQPRAR